MTTVSESAYEEAQELFLGFCPDCKAFVDTPTEDDATDYPCPDCEGSEVMGPGEAVLRGLVEVVPDEEDPWS